jgi:hypothetical protein
VKVAAIGISPAQFKAGDQVTLSVTLQNTSASPYACVGSTYYGVSVYISKARPSTVANTVFSGHQPLTSPLAAHERRTVTLTTKWTVPSVDTPQFYVQAWGPICGSDEFGNTAEVTIPRVCVYNFTPTITAVVAPLSQRLSIKP